MRRDNAGAGCPAPLVVIGIVASAAIVASLGSTVGSSISGTGPEIDTMFDTSPTFPASSKALMA